MFVTLTFFKVEIKTYFKKLSKKCQLFKKKGEKLTANQESLTRHGQKSIFYLVQ
jgi:hypothetical protein